MSPTNTTTKSTSKSAKKSRTVTLTLNPDLLSRFPADVPAVKPRSSSSVKPDPSPSVQPPESVDKSSESNSTPLPSNGNDETDPNSLAPPKTDNKRKKEGAAVTGRKRAPPSIDPNAPPRERGRPGPKKKPRLPDGSIDRTTDPNKKGPIPGPNPISTHRLGPKANTGAINAGLRALDRSGKPCRKWEQKGLQIKSFTGTAWNTSSWKAPTRDSAFAGDVKSDSTGSSDVKLGNSSALPSEQSNSGVDGGETMLTNGLESSPAPPVAA